MSEEQGFITKKKKRVPKKVQPSGEYPYDRIPPVLADCEAHLKASTIGFLTEDEARRQEQQGGDVICDCCAQNLHKEQFAYCAAADDLAPLGPGIPLYFQYLFWCIFILVALMICEGCYTIYDNLQGEYCAKVLKDDIAEYVADDPDACIWSWATAFSIANKKTDKDQLNIGFGLNMGSCFVMLLLLMIYRKVQRDSAVEIDERADTAQDYAICVKGFTCEDEIHDVDQELAEYLQHNAIPGRKTNVRKVNLCYNLTKYFDLVYKKDRAIDKKQEWIKKNKNAERSGNQLNPEEIRPVEDEISEFSRKISRMEGEYEKGLMTGYCGWAFVSFATQWEVKQVLKHWKVTGYKKAMMKMFPGMYKNNFHLYKGKFIDIVKAPEPTDVYWENLHITTTQKVIRRLVGDIVTILGMALLWCIIYGIALWQVIVRNDPSFNVALVKIITLISALVIIVINFIAKMIIVWAAKFGKYSTWTEYDLNIARKLTFAQFLNTALITFLIKISFGQVWGIAGLIVGTYLVFVTNALISPIMKLIDFGYCWRKFKIGRVRKQIQEGTSVLTQEEANKIFELPDVMLSDSYAAHTKTMLFAAFYHAIIPLGTVWSILGLIASFWIEKWVIIKHRKNPRQFGDELANEMIEVLEFIVITYGVSIVIFDYLILEKICYISIGILAIGIINALLPMEEINIFIFGSAQETLSADRYDQAQFEFPSDYDRENPATRRKAIEKFRNLAEKKQGGHQH